MALVGIVSHISPKSYTIMFSSGLVTALYDCLQDVVVVLVIDPS